MIRGEQYDGFKADVFAAGIALFILVTGLPPYYKKASASDPYYKCFIKDTMGMYWNKVI